MPAVWLIAAAQQKVGGYPFPAGLAFAKAEYRMKKSAITTRVIRIFFLRLNSRVSNH